MDKYGMIALGYPVGVGLAALGAGIGLGRAVGSGLEAMGRQPEAAGRLLINMIIGCAFIEALAIYALISVYVANGPILTAGH
jgi:F-type H+-transporting ATPase subunit c